MKSIFLKILIFVNIALLGGQLMLSFTRATQGTLVAELNQKTQSLKSDNAQLREQIYSRSSLVYIELQARSLALKP